MSELLLYQTEDGQTQPEVGLSEDAVWLPLAQKSGLVQHDKAVAWCQIRNVFEEGELQRDAGVANFATPAADGKIDRFEHFSLDAIISVRHKTKSRPGAQSRSEANQANLSSTPRRDGSL